MCPNCREPIDAQTRACPNRHGFAERDGVLVLLAASFERRLADFAETLASIRAAEGKRLMDAAAYEGLPESQLGAGDAAWRDEWRLRRVDLAVVSRYVSGCKRVLDVGAWNGWLSHRLARLGHEVTAVDYFADPFDGLGARRHYSTRWRAIQMDLLDLSLLDEPFDAVILNRCLSFSPDPAAYVIHARGRLAPGGVLIATGLQFFRDPVAKAREVETAKRHYAERYGFELFLRPTKGFLDGGDDRRLRRAGLSLKPYPHLWRANLRSWLDRTRPRHAFGLCVAGPHA